MDGIKSIEEIFKYWEDCFKNDLPGPLLDEETAEKVLKICNKKGYKARIEPYTDELFEVVV